MVSKSVVVSKPLLLPFDTYQQISVVQIVRRQFAVNKGVRGSKIYIFGYITRGKFPNPKIFLNHPVNPYIF